MNYRALIFDLDGTIVNTIEDICYFCNKVLSENGYETRKVSDYEGYVGWGIPATLRKALAPVVVDDLKLDEMYQRFLELYRAQPVKFSVPYDGIVDLMRDFKANGGYVGVCTNKTEVVAKKVIKALFGDLVDSVAGVSPDCPPKPEPTSVSSIVASSDCEKEDILYVGDSVVDIETSRGVDLRVAAVTWGYFDVDRLREANPDFFCDDVMALRKIIGV